MDSMAQHSTALHSTARHGTRFKHAKQGATEHSTAQHGLHHGRQQGQKKGITASAQHDSRAQHSAAQQTHLVLEVVDENS